MSINACAALVEAGDPDRFLAAMAAPPDLRGQLFVLSALNLEIAKAPFVTQEPMIAEMRLQFWRDVVSDAAAGKPVRAHEVAGPLADLIVAQALPAERLDEMIAARRFDIYPADPGLWSFYLALVLLGLGWNFGFIGATTLLSSSHSPDERGIVQGMNDMLVFGFVTFASLASGGLMNCAGGTPVDGWLAVNLAMIPFLVLAGVALVWLMRLKPRAVV